MKKIILLSLGLLVLLWGCGSEKKNTITAVGGEAEIFILEEGRVQPVYTGEDFVSFLRTLDEWKEYTEPIEVTELTSEPVFIAEPGSSAEPGSIPKPVFSGERVFTDLGCQVFKELVHYKTYILKENKMIRIGSAEGGTGVESIGALSLNGRNPDALLYTVSAGDEAAPRTRVACYAFELEREFTFSEGFPSPDSTLKRISNTKYALYAGTPLEPDVMDPWMTRLGTLTVKNGLPVMVAE